jgi:Regulator of chromosome condensation (RCC1) repeat
VLPGTYTDVSAGGFHTCGVTSSGSVACWGYNAYAQTDVPTGTFTRVSAGDYHTCGIKSDGGIACWGRDNNGQSTVPTPPPPGIAPVGVDVPVNAVDGTTGELAPVLLTFDNVTTGGEVTVTSGQVGSNATPGAPPAPSSSNFRLGSPPLYYNITTDAAFTGSVQVCVTYPELAFKNTKNLRLLHYEGGAWVALPDQTVNTATRTVCASTTSFSPFMIGEIEFAPAVTQVQLIANPIPVNTATQLDATFTDENLDDTHTGSFAWNSGSVAGSVIELSGVGTLGISQAFSTPGVYTITASVSDGDLAGSRSSTLDMPSYLVVYDPSAGFVTGGGWFDSPAGACHWSGCASDGSSNGKASFGFVSRYQRGATTPTGNTEFQFKAGGLTFRSTSYQWLVVAGARAQYKGEGQITGDGGAYGFLITAIDGAVAGGGGTDRFRIKLWNIATGDIVYDNKLGALEDSDAATGIGGGSIVIHR